MMSNSCPPGMLCINYSHVMIVFTLITIGIIFYFNRLGDKIDDIKKFKIEDENIQQIKQQQIEQQIQQQIQQQQIQQQQIQQNNNSNQNQLLQEPSRAINIPTRGEQPEIQQVGILSKIGIENNSQKPGDNDKTAVLPLLGAPTYRGSNRWIYWTATDKYNQIKIPISNKGKTCEDTGCEEIYDGDQINVSELNGIFNVKLYNNTKLRYIPYV